METLNKILNSGNIPFNTIEMIKKLDEDGKKLLNDYYDEDSDLWKYVQREKIAKRFYADPDIVETLYHYTSYDSFEKIIDSYQFLVGSIHFMNDNQELKYTFNMMKNELENIGAPREVIQNFESFVAEVQLDAYIWSFSENNHSQALQNYGDIALGFNNQQIMNQLGTKYSKGAKNLNEYTIGNAYVFPVKVEYDSSIQRNHINTIAKSWYTCVRNINIDPDDMSQILGDLVQALIFFSLIFKNPKLYQEEEIRFIVLKIGENDKINPDLYLNQKPVINCEFKSEMIQKVILSNKLKNHFDAVKRSLISKNYGNTEVVMTDLPY